VLYVLDMPYVLYLLYLLHLTWMVERDFRSVTAALLRLYCFFTEALLLRYCFPASVLQRDLGHTTALRQYLNFCTSTASKLSACICVRILLYMLYMCPHTTIPAVYVSSYYYTCGICVLILLNLLYMCPPTTIPVPAFCRICACILVYMCPHTTIICVRVQLYMSPHTWTYLCGRAPSKQVKSKSTERVLN
jgi:hypothetical protein